MAAVTICSDSGAPPKKSDTVSPSICHEVMGLDARILVFWMLSFKPTFSFCHKGGVICISEVTDISPGNLDSSLCFIHPYFAWCTLLVAQSFPTLCDSMDYNLPVSSVHGILTTRILEWVSMPFSRRSSRPRDGTQVSHIAGRFFTVWVPQVFHGSPPNHFLAICWSCNLLNFFEISDSH